MASNQLCQIFFIEPPPPPKKKLSATHMPYISLKILKPQSTSIHQLQFFFFLFCFKEEEEEEEEIKDKINGGEWQNLNRLPV